MSAITIAQEHLGLTDIDDVDRFDPERDQPLFNDIKKVLEKHGALSRFGVTLLHKHFDVYEGERLVEFCDHETRTLTLRPISESPGPNQTHVATNWRFDTGSPEVNQRCFAECLTTQGVHTSEVHKKKK